MTGDQQIAMTATLSDTDDFTMAPLLGANDPAPFDILNEGGKAKCILICEHSGGAVPESLSHLGLSSQDFDKHFALDIGVRHLTSQLSGLLDAPAILANFSRLVIDLNRRVDHPTAFVTNAEGRPIPGNMGMTPEDRLCRTAEIYIPFHKKIESMISGFIAQDIVPVVISIHSFSPVFFKQIRPWDLGVLWVQDPRLPVPVIEHFRKKDFCVGDNEPYDARVLRGTTINHHADARGFPNALFELRNELIDTDEKGAQWATLLKDCLQGVLADEALYDYYDGPQHVHDPERALTYFDELMEKAKRGE